MKNIKQFYPDKYNDPKYEKVQENIYKYKDENGKTYFCTSLTFEQEPKYDEGENSKMISQYPLEDILDKFYVHVSDFFDELNNGESNVCYYEFSAAEEKYILNLQKSIIGKHVYNKLKKGYVELIIK